MISLLTTNLHNKDLIIWDFDGVIKDSLIPKSNCFLSLFSGFDPNILLKINEHHLSNGGMSRFKKLPIYIEMVGQVPSDKLVSGYLDKLSSLMFNAVVNSDWVPGFLSRIKTIPESTKSIIVTGTPLSEMNDILFHLNILNFFEKVYGAPMIKVDSISSALSAFAVSPADSMMIGDSLIDLNASLFHGIPFFLRRHLHNSDIVVHQDFEFTDFND